MAMCNQSWQVLMIFIAHVQGRLPARDEENHLVHYCHGRRVRRWGYCFSYLWLSSRERTTRKLQTYCCYVLEFCKLKSTSTEQVTCTSKLQTWNQPTRKRVLDPEKASDIKFVKLVHGTTKREPITRVYDPRPAQLQQTTSEEVRHFRSALCNLSRPSGFLHVLVDDDTQPTPNVTRLPPAPRSEREKVIARMKAMEHPLSLQQIAELGKCFINSISLSVEVKSIVEQHTRSQAASKRWHEEHFARITASKFGEIVKSRSRLTLCSRLLYPDTGKSLDSSAAIQWGRDNEAIALQQ